MRGWGVVAQSEFFESDLMWRHPSTKLRVLRRLEVVAIFALLILVTIIVAAATRGMEAGAPVAVALLVLGVLSDWTVGRRVRAWAFTERRDDLIVRRGVMFRRLSVVPYGRMQFIDVTAGPLERLFDLATVRLHTAAAASDARIPGLSAEDAGRLRDQLASLGEARLAGL
jgi:uncharacterized protein